MSGSDRHNRITFATGCATDGDSMTPRRYDDSIDSLDDYNTNTPLEARFDPMTIQMIVTEGFQKHEAYGMPFKDYSVKRNQLSQYDTTEKKRLSTRFSNYFAHLCSDIAMDNKMSQIRTMILLVEIGLINFQVDYHDEYHAIKDTRSRLYHGARSNEDKALYRQIEKHTILLEKFGGMQTHFVPYVPEWLYNAVNDVKGYLNMSASDFMFFCWCYGCMTGFQENEIPDVFMEDIRKVCDEFRSGIEVSSRLIGLIQYDKK
jgi:hypothetical protein